MISARDDKITRDTISARYLMATLPDKHTPVVYPSDKTIVRYPAKVARGARRVKSGAMGAMPTSGFQGYKKYAAPDLRR